MNHETTCTLYKLARIGQQLEADRGWPVTPTEELVDHLRAKLFGETQ